MKMQKVLSLKDELAKKNPKLQGKFFLTEKFDGWYVQIHYNPLTGWESPISSAGRHIPSLAWLKEEFNSSQFPKSSTPFILIAEVYLEGTPFHITNGLLNRSVGDCSLRGVTFVLHDCLDITSIALNAKDRLDTLINFRSYIYPHKDYHFDLISILDVAEYNYGKWQTIFDSVVNKGGEGIIAKRIDSFYSSGKRNSDLLKLKLECTVEAVAMELEHTIGEKGNPGLTLISQLANGIKVRTVINKHEDIALFTNNSHLLGTTVVQLKAMEELEDGQLRQPVFQFIRYDKLVSEILK